MPKYTQAGYTTKFEVELDDLHALLQMVVSRAYDVGYKHASLGKERQPPNVRKELLWKLRKVV